MIDYNAGAVRDGYVRPTDESAPDLSQAEMDEMECDHNYEHDDDAKD